MTKLIQSSGNMCDSSPCVIVCEQWVEKSHNTLEKTVQNKPKLRNQIMHKM